MFIVYTHIFGRQKSRSQHCGVLHGSSQCFQADDGEEQCGYRCHHLRFSWVSWWPVDESNRFLAAGGGWWIKSFEFQSFSKCSPIKGKSCWISAADWCTGAIFGVFLLRLGCGCLHSLSEHLRLHRLRWKESWHLVTHCHIHHMMRNLSFWLGFDFSNFFGVYLNKDVSLNETLSWGLIVALYD